MRKTRMADQIDHGRFIVLLAERFPDVAAAIDDCSRGLLHLEMATLRRATQAAIDAGDRDTVRQHFQFIDAPAESAKRGDATGRLRGQPLMVMDGPSDPARVLPAPDRRRAPHH